LKLGCPLRPLRPLRFKDFALQFSLLAISAILAILVSASFAVKRFCLSDHGDHPITRDHPISR
jgi:hypothetical protein